MPHWPDEGCGVGIWVQERMRSEERISKSMRAGKRGWKSRGSFAARSEEIERNRALS